MAVGGGRVKDWWRAGWLAVFSRLANSHAGLGRPPASALRLHLHLHARFAFALLAGWSVGGSVLQWWPLISAPLAVPGDQETGRRAGAFFRVQISGDDFIPDGAEAS